MSSINLWKKICITLIKGKKGQAIALKKSYLAFKRLILKTEQKENMRAFFIAKLFKILVFNIVHS